MNTSDDRNAILARLKVLVPERIAVDPIMLTADAKLGEIGIDSFALIELIFLAEEEFNIKIPIEGLEVETIADVVDVIQRKIASVEIG